MADIKFKGSGIQSDDPSFERKGDTRPLGIKTPLEFGTKEAGLLKLHYSPKDQVADNFRNLILTNYGERLGRYHYGANLKPLTTERMSGDDFDAEAMARIKDATSKYMPYVELEAFESFTEPSTDGVIGRVVIRVTYSARSLGVKRAAIEVILGTIG